MCRVVLRTKSNQLTLNMTSLGTDGISNIAFKALAPASTDFKLEEEIMCNKESIISSLTKNLLPIDTKKLYKSGKQCRYTTRVSIP